MEQKCTLQHFTHSHTLYREVSNHYGNLTKEGNPSDEFMCDACHTLGSGARFHCKQCSFDLHEECANCPEYLNTYIHPNHQLELRWEGSIKRDYGKSRPCDICGDQVKGLFYTCSSGAEKRYDDGRHFFFIHPLCSKFPPRVPHGIDKNHPLRFQLVPVIPDSFCAICGDVVFSCSWSYRCDPCGVNIHLECVALPFDDHHRSGITYSSSRSLKDPQAQTHQQKGPVHPPYGGYTGTTPFTPPPYNNYGPPAPPSYNYYPYPPPPNDTYYYQQPPQPYGNPPTPPPPYYNHHQPHAPTKTETTSSSGDNAPPKKETKSSTHGSKKKRSAKVIGRIAVSLLLSSVLGVVVPMGSTG
ncbi:hypothetical protein MKW98_020987 [Papaver atlanticum]|uniref:DC1 domain-containing protein n=1 Tax=Papaver atlanticum TaxID=357466 RepID=A0AAD4SMU7_9MAGN|nr:hypothetical protein MKW98_020987 [Papaver atlanticum]